MITYDKVAARSNASDFEVVITCETSEELACAKGVVCLIGEGADPSALVPAQRAIYDRLAGLNATIISHMHWDGSIIRVECLAF